MIIPNVHVASILNFKWSAVNLELDFLQKKRAEHPNVAKREINSNFKFDCNRKIKIKMKIKSVKIRGLIPVACNDIFFFLIYF